MTLKKLQQLVVAALEELKGIDIVCLNVKKLTSVTDMMVICTGTSNRHVKSLAENVVKIIKANNLKPLGVEGETDSEWILIDLGEIMVHVMQQKTRDFYGLEKLWQLPTTRRKSTPSRSE